MAKTFLLKFSFFTYLIVQLVNKSTIKNRGNAFLKELGGFVLKVMKIFSLFCFYLVELSLRFQIMCRLCIYDSPFPSKGFSNMKINQIQYFAILIVFTLYLMLEFVQIYRPYTVPAIKKGGGVRRLRKRSVRIFLCVRSTKQP